MAIKPIDWPTIQKTTKRSLWGEVALPPSGVFDIVTSAANVVRTSAEIINTIIDVLKAIIDAIRFISAPITAGKGLLQTILESLVDLLTDVFGGQGMHLLVTPPIVIEKDATEVLRLVDILEASLEDEYDHKRPKYSDEAAIGAFYLISKAKIFFDFPELEFDFDLDFDIEKQYIKAPTPKVDLKGIPSVQSTGGLSGDLIPVVYLWWDKYPWNKYIPAFQTISPYHRPYKVYLYRDTEPFGTNNPLIYEDKIIATLDYDFDSLSPETDYFDIEVEADTDYWYAAGFAYDSWFTIEQYMNDEPKIPRVSEFPKQFSNIVHIHTKIEAAKIGSAPEPNWRGYKLPIYAFPELLKLVNILRNFIGSAQKAGTLGEQSTLDMIYNWLTSTQKQFTDLADQIGDAIDNLNAMFNALAGVYSFYIASEQGGNKAMVENLRYMLAPPKNMKDGPSKMKVSTEQPIEFGQALEQLIAQTTNDGTYAPLQFGRAPEFGKGDVVFLSVLATGSEDPATYGAIYGFIKFLSFFFGSAGEDTTTITDIIDQITLATGVVQDINFNLEMQLGIPPTAAKIPPFPLGEDLEEADEDAACST